MCRLIELNHTYVCFSCRRSVKARYGREVKCPNCTQFMLDCGNSVHIPRQTNHTAWRQLEILKKGVGETFFHCCPGRSKSPVTSLREAKERLATKVRRSPELFTPEWFDYKNALRRYRKDPYA